VSSGRGCRRAEHAHDGAGKGSVFTVRLPLAVLPLQPLQAQARTTNRCKVLLVEDLADSREMLRLLLESGGHAVIDLADGGAAIEAIERERPQVAFIGIGLPGMSGY